MVGASLNGNASELHKLVEQGGYGLQQMVQGMHSRLATGKDEASLKYQDHYRRASELEMQGPAKIQEDEAKFGWMIGAMTTSGQDSNVAEIASALVGMRAADTPAVGEFEGSSAPLFDASKLQSVEARIKGQEGRLASNPAASVRGADHEAYYKGIMSGELVIAQVPDRPASDIPAAPNKIEVNRSPEELAQWAATADRMATQGTLGMGKYFVETASAPAANIADTYWKEIGVPFAEAVRQGGFEGGTTFLYDYVKDYASKQSDWYQERIGVPFTNWMMDQLKSMGGTVQPANKQNGPDR